MKSSTLYLLLKKPLALGLATFIALLIFSQYIAYQRYLISENEQRKEITNQVDLIKEKLQALVMYSYTATKSLAYIVERNGIPADFDNIAVELLQRSKYFDVVELVDANGFITHVYPLKDNPVIGFNIIKSIEASSGALATIKRGDFFIAGPVNLNQGGVGMISRQPIFIDGNFSGFSAVVTKLSTFFNDLNIDTSNNSRFMYQLSRMNGDTGAEEYFLESDISSYKEFAVPIKMPYVEWKLYVVPMNRSYKISILFVLFGFVIAILGGWGVWFFTGRTVRINKIISSKLKEQESQLISNYESSRKEIEKSEANLKRAQQIAKIGSWELDLVNNKLFWSEEVFRIFKKNPEKFEPSFEKFLNVVHPDDRELVNNAFIASVENKKPSQLVHRLLFDDQSIKYVLEQSETYYDEKGNPVKSLGIVQDITDRTKIEEVLKNSELLYRSLTSNAPVGIFNANELGDCTYVNEELLKYSGKSFEETMDAGWHNSLHPEDKENVIKEWEEAILTKTDFNSEFRFQNTNGKITFLAAKAVKILDGNNKVTGYIGIASDITERTANEKELFIYKTNLEKLVNLRTEELSDSQEALLNLVEDLNLQSSQLEKEKQKAQSADLMKSAFLATMSHELRTPMNSIIGFTGILLKEFAGPLNEEQKKQLSMVKNSSQHLLGLINDILDISKIEAGKLKVSLVPFNYLTTLEKTIDFILPQASKKELIINSVISEIEITLNSDERRVEQVLLNLLSNAIKFSSDGAIQVKVDIADNVVITQVIDKGIGIDEKDLDKLFMPFIQLEGGLSRSHQGTGLGLAICKSLVEKLGGTINVQSTKGEGSNFTFTLPLDTAKNK